MSKLAARIINRVRIIINGFALWSFRVSLICFDFARQIEKSGSGSSELTKFRNVFVSKSKSHPEPANSGKRDSNHRSVISAKETGAVPDYMPIVFIHSSNSEHLKYAFKQARTSNPNSPIYLLGDATNNRYDYIEHRAYGDYFEGATQFAELYRHYSTHGPEFELICFQRWFILRDFLAQSKIRRCLYLDSDTMLYANVTDDHSKFERFDFTLCWRTIGCVFFLQKLEGLENFCQFLLDLYSGKEPYLFDKMIAHYATRQKHNLAGGVCDMTALDLYNETNFGRVGEASQIIEGSVYDPNINLPQPGFRMENGIKKIIWKQDQPFGQLQSTGEEIRFNSLHFNGRAKALMKQYCTADDAFIRSSTAA